MRTLKNSIVKIVTLFVVLFLLASCSKDDNSSGSSHKVIFKAEASAGSNITVAVYGYDSNNTSATSLSGTTWTSPEVTVPAGAILTSVGVNATGVNASSTLKVQIWVDGVMKNEGTASGSILSAQTSYSF